MFKSYEYINYLDYKDGKYTYVYELTDSEFGTVSGVEVGVGFGVEVEVEVGIAVIQEYSKRNLNVAKNLMLFFIWRNKKYPNRSIQQMIDRNKKHNPLFSQYEEDIQKYLLLL